MFLPTKLYWWSFKTKVKEWKKKLSNFEIAILLVFFFPVLLNFILMSLKLEFAPQLLFSIH